MRELRLGVFLLALASLSFAGLLDSMYLVLPGTIAFVIIMLSLLQMLSSAIQLPQLEAWVKLEIRELITAAILVVIVFSLFSASTNIISLLSGKTINYSPGNAPQTDAVTSSLFDERLGTINNAYLDTMEAFHRIGLKSGFSTSISIPIYWVGFIGGGAPFAGYGILFVFLSQASQALSTAFFIYSGLKVLMNFLLPATQPLLFLAFVFRFIPFTRQFGNTLIALIIAAGVFLPFSVILVSEFHNALGDGLPKPNITDLVFETQIGGMPSASLPNAVCSSFVIRTILASFGEIGMSIPCYFIPFPPAAAVCFNLVTWVIYPVTLATYLIVQSTRLISLTYGGEGAISDVFNGLFPFLADVVKTAALSYIDVIIIGTIVVIGAKSISAALGGETFLSGIQRLL